MTDFPTLMNTKLYRPPTPADFVSRVGLGEQLNQALKRPLTLISAPAGYGKTTLASAWMEGLDCPKAWLSLDDSDNQLGGFLAYFLAAIQSISPDAILQTRLLLQESSLPPLQDIVSSLSNDLFHLAPAFVLVLDDYSVIRDPAIHQIFAELLKHPPISMHLVLSCRHDPPLPVNVLRARHQMVEVRRQGLRFSRAEIETFMQYMIGQPLDERAITILEEKTEGWAAGLRLAALSLLYNDNIEERFTIMEGDNRFLLEYLADEVISGLPQEIRDFLLSTSILDRLCGSLCDRVIEAGDSEGKSQAYLEWLERANLFTIPLDSRQTWYRYHRLFHEILRLLLIKERKPDEVALLHARASAWFSENNYLDEAFSHAIASRDENLVIQLVESHRHQAMDQERWQQVERWMRLIPRRLIDRRPELLLLEAWAINRSEPQTDISAALDRVEALIEKENGPGDASRQLRSEIDALRSQQLYGQADPQVSLEFACSTLETTELEFSSVRAAAWMAQATALHMKGDRNGAIETLYEGLKEDSYHYNTFPTRLLIALGSIYWVEADPGNLSQTAEYLLKLATERELPDSLSWAHYFLGVASYQRNDLAAAENHFSWVISQPANASSFPFYQSIFGLAATYQAQGLSERGQELVESAMPMALERNNPRLISEIRAYLARLSLSQGNIVEAQHWAAQCERCLQASPLPAFDYPLVTLIRVLIDQGAPESLQEAAGLLDGMSAYAEATNNSIYRITSLALKALLQDACGQEAEALDDLCQSVLMAQPGGVVRLYVDLGPRMAILINRLYRQGVAPDYLKGILDAFPSQNSVPAAPPPGNLIEPLTDRELEILILLAQRLSNKEIAQELVISPMTVKRHTINIYQKLNTNSRREAVDVASSLGLVNLPALAVRPEVKSYAAMR